MALICQVSWSNVYTCFII